MLGHFVGPMPISEFFEDFMTSTEPIPAQPTAPFAFNTAAPVFETEFIRAIEAADVAPSLHLCDTRFTGDRAYPVDRKPDISCYRRHVDVAPDPRRDTNWRQMDLFLEVKPRKFDPFIVPEDDENKEVKFEHQGEGAEESLGQMISYARAHITSQFRTHLFSVCLLKGTASEGPSARFIRWDRGGSVVSERVDWLQEPEKLAKFFWLFNHLTLSERGHDITVTSATPEEALLAKPKLAATGFWAKGVPDQLHKILVHDEEKHEDRYFITPSAVSANPAIIGRATLGFVAYDCANDCCVYLKDSWRIDVDAIEKEGLVYRRLWDHKVPHIAEFDCAGDVRVLGAEGEAAFQSTKTHLYANRPWACKTGRLIPHRHYRLVLKTIGRSVTMFQSTHQLGTVIYHALLAHAAAWKLAKILHRDISVGNVLIDLDGKSGFLIDWDLSKTVDEDEEQARQEWRTGTWQFISIYRLSNPTTSRHLLSDDLESALWLFVYNLFTYRPCDNLDQTMLGETLTNIFDGFSVQSDGTVQGGFGKKAFLTGWHTPTAAEVRASFPPPCAALVEDLRSFFKDLYSPDATPAVREQTMRALQSSDRILSFFATRLAEDGWPTNDGSVEKVFPVPKSKIVLPQRLTAAKRKSAAVEGAAVGPPPKALKLSDFVQCSTRTPPRSSLSLPPP